MIDWRLDPNWSRKAIPDHELAAALIMLSRMSTLSEWSIRARHSPRGRRQLRTTEGSLATLLVALWEFRSAQVTLLDRVQQGLRSDVMDPFGIRWHRAPELRRLASRGHPAVYSKVHEGLGRHLDAFANAIEASPFFGRNLTERQRSDNLAFQQRVIDDLVAGWFPRLPQPDLWTTDATGLRSFARPGKDPDFSWIHQTPTQRDYVEKIYGGYGNILAGVNLDGHMPYPAVVFSFRLPLPPENRHLDQVALQMVDSCLQRGFGPAVMVTDSYYPHLSDWSLNLATRGLRMIGDLQSRDVGRKPDILGARFIDGCLHCPFVRLREDLPSPKQKGDALVAYQAANSYRAKFACETISETATTLTLVCPAQAGKVRCRRWENTLRLGNRYPEIDDAPAPEDTAPPVCRGPIEVPRTTRWIRKIWMPYYYGGDEWRRYWETGRPRAEGVFGYLFGDNTRRATVGVTNWVGQARTSLVYAAALAIQNLLLLRTWWYGTSAREMLPAQHRRELEQDPLLWPWDDLAALLPDLLDRLG